MAGERKIRRLNLHRSQYHTGELYADRKKRGGRETLMRRKKVEDIFRKEGIGVGTGD